MENQKKIIVGVRFGKPIIFENKEIALEMLGKNAQIWEFDVSDFEKSGKQMYVINGEPTINATIEQIEEIRIKDRIAHIKGQLILIDRSSCPRCARAVLLQTAKKARIKGFDIEKLENMNWKLLYCARNYQN